MASKIRYYRKLVSAWLVILGSFLLLEHIMSWGGTDLWDLGYGHEWYGLLLIIAGFLVALKNKGKFKKSQQQMAVAIRK